MSVVPLSITAGLTKVAEVKLKDRPPAENEIPVKGMLSALYAPVVSGTTGMEIRVPVNFARSTPPKRTFPSAESAKN